MKRQRANARGFEACGRQIGGGHRPFVVAEISGNHGGDIERAFDLIQAAADAGADAVKFQTYEAETLTIDSNAPAFIVDTPLWRGRRLFDLYREAQTPFAWHGRLFAKAADAGIAAFSAPFDHSAVDLLEGLDCPLYKIASCELVDLPLIERVARTGRPLIMSTGMARKPEIEEAVAAAKGVGARDIALLHCVSGYPSKLSDANLTSITWLADEFDLPIGLSDHSPGIVAPVAAVALGAAIIEKHMCLARGDGTVDSDFSLEPKEFAELVTACRDAHAALGAPVDGALGAEADSLRFRRSLYIVADMAAGEAFSAANVRSIRPAGGLHTRHLAAVLGRTATRAISAGTALAWDMVDMETETS